MAAEEAKTVELAAIIREIQDRVRARYPIHTAGETNIPLADLTNTVHARDRAEAKVAAIGTVNPRPPGLVNNVIQAAKRGIARSFNWLLRDQIEFNRASVDCVNTLMEAINEGNRAIKALAVQTDRRFEELRQDLRVESETLRQAADKLQTRSVEIAAIGPEFNDIRQHWIHWRQEWERKLSINEVQFLRSVADLQSGFHHRSTLMESTFRDLVASQHKDYNAALERTGAEIQKTFWKDIDAVRSEFEKLIHYELRIVRQRATALSFPGGAAVGGPAEPAVDWIRFADGYRGKFEDIRDRQRRHVEKFQGCRRVLDLGCGRGEFLDCLREAGIAATGIESNAEMAGFCRSRGLEAEMADMFAYLAQSKNSIDGIFCSQVVEHLPPARVPELIALAAAALEPGGRILLETPNPECLAIFASHFYIDPTHQRPVPATLLGFYLEEAGFKGISVEYLNPAIETMPSLASLPEEFRHAFFGGLDYAISARRI